MNVACYCRYSSDNQRHESIDAQLAAIKDYCKKEGHTLVKTYIDEAESATNDDREQFLSIFDDIDSGLFKSLNIEALVVHKLNRFARNRYDSIYYKRKLKNAGITRISVTEKLDDSPESVILESMIEGIAEYQSKDLSREVLKGLRENAKQCKVTGSTPILGYKVQDSKYVIDEDESFIVQKIFSDYYAGISYQKIVQWLNSNGYRTRRGCMFRSSNMYRILRNVKYKGTYSYNTKSETITIEDGIPAIIDKELFDKVQVMLEDNKKNSQTFKAKEVYILSGLIYCHCGGRMNGSRKGDRYAHYICMNRKQLKICDAKSIHKKKIEAKVIDYLETNLFSTEAKKALINKVTRKYNCDQDTSNKEKDMLTKNLRKTEKEINNIVDAISQGMFHVSMKKKLDELEQQKTAILVALNTQDNPRLNFDDFMKKLNLGKGLKTKSLEEQKKIVKTFVKRVTVYEDDEIIELYEW